MIYLEGESGEELIEFPKFVPQHEFDATYCGLVRGEDAAVGMLEHCLELTALGVCEVPMQDERVSSYNGNIPAVREWRAETLSVIVGCFRVMSIGCDCLQRAGVFPTKILVPPRQNLSFKCEYGRNPFKLRFAWKRHEGPGR